MSLSRQAHFIIAGLVGLAAAPAVAAPVTDAAAVPNLAPADRAQYARFLGETPHRAFAIGPAGQFGWSAGRDDQFSAILGAVYNCNSAGKVLCDAYAVDDTVVFGAYRQNAAASAAELQQLRGRRLAASYANEAVDYGEAPTRSLHPFNVSGGTPLGVPGARTILTRYVAEQLAGRAPPILIDVSNSWGSHDTLPTALWLRGGGDDAGAKNTEVDRLFAALLASIAPDRNTPLVLFCDSSICWSSYNAALRAVAAGYVNVYWYRGGIEAWRAAGLPMVTSVLSAQLW